MKKRIALMVIIIGMIILGGWVYLQIEAKPIEYITPSREIECSKPPPQVVMLLQEENDTDEDNEDVDIDITELSEEFFNTMMANPFIFAIIICTLILVIILIVGVIFYIRAKHKEANYYSRKPRMKKR